MAGAARVGSLHIMLGLDSAQFTAGLAKANAGLSKFAAGAKVGLAAVAVAAAAAGTALAIAVKGAIDNADSMGEMAEKVGVSVEALTRLGYAAKLSGTDTDTLATGLRKLSQNMLAIAQGSTGPVAATFTALGVSAQNANGSLRASDEVLVDVADKFSRMEDGATKTALAVQIFGKSGAELIPFLNQGRDGISALTAEADRLGITISGTTSAAAGQFNDTLDRLRATFDGVINKIMAGALPSLNQLGDKLADPAFAAAAAALAQGVVGAINAIVDAVSAAGNKLREFGDLLDWMSSRDWSTGELDPNKVAARRSGAMAELAGQLGRGDAEAPSASFLDSVFGAPAAQVAASAQQVATAFEPVITNTNATTAAASAMSKAVSDAKAVFDATRTPAEAYGIEIEKLNALLKAGRIDQETYARAVKQAQDAMTAATQTTVATFDAMGELKSIAGNLGGALVDAFTGGENASEAFFKAAMNGLSSLTNKLADMAISGIFDLLAGAFGGGFGGGKTLKLGFNGIPGFANGTNYAPGGLAMVGERGPELVNLPRGSQVIPNNQLRGGGMSVVRLELSADLEARILEQSAGQSVQIVQAAAPSIASEGAAAAGSALGRGDFDGSMRRFGSTPQAKRR